MAKKRSKLQYQGLMSNDRATHRLAKYGITAEQYRVLLESQDYRCKICRLHQTENAGKGRPLHVDHDHKTGRVRGLLCHWCNTLLGSAKDNPLILLKAIQYLKGRL